MTNTPPYPETPLKAARMYGDSGWRVVPIVNETKRPAIEEWQNRASKHPDQITSWWTNGYAQCGVGIVTGKETGMWVLDVDVANGKQGVETLAALIKANGGGKLPTTLVARTPSGGYHYYWKYPQGVEVRNAQELGAGLDVRGEGGQVLAPPTTRAAGSYYWHDDHGPYDAEVVYAPEWLLELVSFKPPSEAALRTFDAGTNEQPAYVIKYNAEHTWEDLLTGDSWVFDHSDSNDVGYWVRPGKDAREGTSATTYHAGLNMLWVFTTAHPFLKAEQGYDPWGYMVRRDFDGDFKAAGRVFYDRSQPMSVDLLAPEQGSEEVQLSRLEQAEIQISSAAFWDAEQQNEDFLISPFIAMGRGHALYAEAKAGKSYVVLQALAAAAVPGHTSWSDPVKVPVNILYLDYEMTQEDLRERLEIFGYSINDDFSHLRYIKASMLGADLDTYEGGRELLEQAQKWQSQLVVIDTMSRAVSGDENDADTVRRFFQHTGRLLKANGIAWLRIDHAGKVVDRGQRGSSGKNDDVDVVWRLDRVDGGAILELTHTRVFWMPPQIHLAVKEDTETAEIVHIRANGPGWAAGVHAKAAEWVELDIPLEASRRQATALGFKCKASLFPQIKRFVNEESQRLGIVGLVPNQPGTREPGNQ